MIYITKGLLPAANKQSSQVSNSNKEKELGFLKDFFFFCK